MRFSLFLFLTLLAGINTVFAQHQSCGTDEYYQQLFREEPQLYHNFQEKIMVKASSRADYRKNNKYVIPVVFHIIHNQGSENIPITKIYAAIKRINEDYQAINEDLSSVRNQFLPLIDSLNIEFRLAGIDPEGKCTDGVTRTLSELTYNATDEVKKLIQWDPAHYLNIWVVNNIEDYGQSGVILGYATFPGGASWRDGIVVRADVVNYNARTLTHEIGHYLGLLHTFQGGCNDNDYVDDTPPEAEAHFDCNKSTNSCSTDSPDLPDMLENHMSYSSCRVMFTRGQVERMNYYLQNYRHELYSTQNLKNTGVWDTNQIICQVKADFYTPKNPVCANQTVQFFDLSKAGKQSTEFYWYFPGGTPSVTTETNPEVIYSSPGKYSVIQVIKSANSYDSLVKENYITVLPDTGFGPLFTEDFEDELYNEAAWTFSSPGNIQWEVTSKAGFNSNKSLYLNNFAITSTDEIYEFELPALDFSELPDAALEFDYAFAKKSSSSNDHLRIYVSYNCGDSWSVRKFINPFKMPTVSDIVTSPFKPSSEDWKHQTIDLNYFTGRPNIHIKFAFYTGGGNNIYIDNLGITSTVSIQERKELQDISVYPNPSRGIFTLRFSRIPSSDFIVSVTDLSGKEVYRKSFTRQNSDSKINLNLDVAPGFYFVAIHSLEISRAFPIIVNP